MTELEALIKLHAVDVDTTVHEPAREMDRVGGDHTFSEGLAHRSQRCAASWGALRLRKVSQFPTPPVSQLGHCLQCLRPTPGYAPFLSGAFNSCRYGACRPGSCMRPDG